MKKEIEIPKGKEIDFDKSTIVLKDKMSEKEKLFLELFQGLQMRSDFEKYPDSVFFFKGDTLMLEIEKDYIFVNYDHIWIYIGDKFDMSYNEKQSFIKEMVEKHFKCKGLMLSGRPLTRLWLVEKHFKWNGLKPFKEKLKDLRTVEKHFNS